MGDDNDWSDDDSWDTGDTYEDENGDTFADPGGVSALRASSPSNPRDCPCPTCEWPNRLTRRDVALGYQCDSCANARETGREIDYYEG